MRFFSEADVDALLDPTSLLAALEQAFIDLSEGRVTQPLRSVMGFSGIGAGTAPGAD